ncbi:MAG: hypothetical protein ABIT38_11485 [Gemmatimonadaceae bacterium]
MSTLTKVKLAFTIMGLIIFAAGARFDDARLRGIAIGFVAVAWAMRFYKPKEAPLDQTPPNDAEQG